MTSGNDADDDDNDDDDDEGDSSPHGRIEPSPGSVDVDRRRAAGLGAVETLVLSRHAVVPCGLEEGHRHRPQAILLLGPHRVPVCVSMDGWI